MNNIRVLILCLTAASFSSANAADVAEMSLEKFIDVASPYWQVEVSCSDSELKRLMTRPIESDVWCSVDATDLCDKNKYSLSRKLCNVSFTQQIGNDALSKPSVNKKALESRVISDSRKSSKITISKPKSDQSKATAEKKTSSNIKADLNNSNELAPKAARDELLFEQVQIEEQRILVEQKKLELRRQELDLQKRQLETKNTK